MGSVAIGHILPLTSCFQDIEDAINCFPIFCSFSAYPWLWWQKTIDVLPLILS